MNDRELDAEFERIISGWDDETPDPHVRADPPDGTPDRGEGQAADQSATADDATQRGAPDIASGGMNLSIAPTTSHVWRGAAVPDDAAAADTTDGDDEHFEPPTMAELPNAEDDPMFWAIVVGLGGGPILLFYLLIFDRDGSGWWVATAIAMTVVGFVLLVLRGGNERDPFDDGTRV